MVAGKSLVVAASLSVLLGGALSQYTERKDKTLRPNQPPVLSASVPTGTDLLLQERVQFTITAVDPEGDALDVRLLNIPPGLVFDPARSDPSPFVGTVDWCVSRAAGGRQVLWFEATDHRSPPVRLELAFDVTGQLGGFLAYFGFPHYFPSSLQVGDVTGDGVLDVIGVAGNADIGGVQDAGAIYVWAGSTALGAAPTATLSVPGAQAGDKLGEFTVRTVDITGDAVLDVIAVATLADVDGVVDAGALYVWIGGSALQGTRAPDGTLSVPGAAPEDLLGFSQGQGLYFGDVTGDGIIDLVAAASEADGVELPDIGALYVWHGRAGPWDTSEPTARLSAAAPHSGERMAHARLESVILGDVTGDDVLDVVSISHTASDGDQPEVGAAYVWQGGSSLLGARTQYAHLLVPGASQNDRLGETQWTQLAFRLVDMTGDGVLDVLAGTSWADIGGVPDVGAFYLWKGGSGLESGTPTATFTVPGAASSDRLGHCSVRRLADVTGDGLPDLVMGSHLADPQGTPDVGLVYVWAASPDLSGDVAPTATLVPSPALSSMLTCYGLGGASPIGHVNETIHFGDVTGDGWIDVIATSSERGYLVPTKPLVGLIFVWAGGPALQGTLAATATLSVPGAKQGDQLGKAPRGVQTVDLTGDGVLDIVAGSPTDGGNATGVGDVGAIYLFEGGSTLVGSVAPRATLRDPTGTTTDKMTRTLIDPSIRFGDVTGDGSLDVVTLSIDRAGPSGAVGAVYVFAGDNGFTGTLGPRARLSDPSARGMSDWYPTTPFLLVDTDHDGVLDVLAISHEAVVEGVTAAGASYVWKGGATLTGDRSADVVARRAVPASERLGITSSDSILVADITGDRKLDLLVGGYQAAVNGVFRAGLILVLPDPLGPAPTQIELVVPGASPNDQLGF